MKRIYIKEIEPEIECQISGWVEKIREHKTMQFVIIKDSTGMIQVAIEKEKSPEIAKVVGTLSRQSVVRFTGKAVKAEMVKLGGIEFLPSAIEVESRAEELPIDEESGKSLKWIIAGLT